MDSHFQHLRRGFNWLGSATIVSKLIDFGTIITVLLFLTKDQVGVASLVVSVGIVVESLNALGTGEALVQAKSISRLQLDSAFWFVMCTASVTAVLTLAASPLIESAYGIPGMAAYFMAIAIKQPLVSASVVPMSLLNRDLKFERIAVINVFATLAAALTRLGLAVAGAGTWALVIGFSSHGLFVLIGVQLARPFVPALRFRMQSISDLVRFGIGAATSNALQQLFKNVDYLLIGLFYGPAQLAIYRVAFDIAMEPAVAVGTLVDRTALPVFARVADVRANLAQAFTWSIRRLVTLVAPLMAVLILAADPLMSLLHDRRGQSYAAAAWPLKLLAVAALLRVSLQLLYPLMMGAGRPGHAVRLAATTLGLLSVGILVAGFSFTAQTGIFAVSAVWIAIYPLLLVWGAFYVRKRCDVSMAQLARAFQIPLIAVSVIVVGTVLLRRIPGSGSPGVSLGIVIMMAVLTYAGMMLYARSRPESLAEA